MSKRLKKYIAFHEQNTNKDGRKMGKTKVWVVVNTMYGIVTGWIQWHGAWRKYCFFPANETLFDWDCLRLVADFCETKTKEHYNSIKIL